MSLVDDLKAAQPARAKHMKILLLDIETYPALTWQWSLRDQYTPPARILQDDGLLCWVAKWYAEPEVSFASLWGDGVEGMAKRMHAMMCEADAVVTYNGARFDIPWLARVIELESGLGPVSPYRHIDLFVAARKFRYLSKSLAYVTDRLSLGHKVDHEGFPLWPKSMPTTLIGGQGDPEAQAKMEEYNRGDVVDTLEPLYDALLPWIKGHPHVGLYAEDGTDLCPRCGEKALDALGETKTPLGVYRRYRCGRCLSWHRGAKTLRSVDLRSA